MVDLEISRSPRGSGYFPNRGTFPTKDLRLSQVALPFVNGDMAKMARLLGHANFSSTLRYLEFLDGSLENAVMAA